MSGLGGFCPLPIRLGGTATEGFTAEQHARASADLLAVARTLPFAVMTFTKSGSSFTVHDYSGLNGVGASYAPSMLDLGNGYTFLFFDKAYADEYGTSYPIVVKHAEVTPHGAIAIIATVETFETSNPEQFAVRTFTAAGVGVDCKVTVELGTWSREPTLGEYDAALDKENCRTEVVPYAWTKYQDLEAALGDGYTRARTGGVHARKLALARADGEAMRVAERFPANANPGTADAALGDWVAIMRLKVSGDEDIHQVRQRLGAKFEAAKGNSADEVDAVCARILGSLFDQNFRSVGSDLATPPAYTYWPDINPGPSSLDLGGGTWSSPRCHLTVGISEAATPEKLDQYRLVNIVLADELDVLLPAWATWTTAFVGDGFTLDEDPLDFTGVLP